MSKLDKRREREKVRAYKFGLKEFASPKRQYKLQDSQHAYELGIAEGKRLADESLHRRGIFE